MTASPPLNGHKRPTMPVYGEWQSVTPEPVEEQRTPQPEPTVDDNAEVARAKAWAEVEERRIAAESAAEKERIAAQAEADAVRAKAEEEARRLRLNNDKLERKAREDDAASEARIAESRKRKADADRAREEADRLAAEQQAAAEAEAAEAEEAENRWRGYARSFYIVCAIVALPVQVAAFYNPHALWLMAAPLMLEGGAWVVLKGAAAAVAGHRPHWHYRLIAWLLAFIAASINLWHGLNAFDPATAIGTAFASVAGPGVWDLHEHGRIRKRDGVLTRRERRAEEKAAKEAAKQKAAEEARRAAEKEAADKAAEAARLELRETRQTVFEDVWAEAVKIGAALAKDPEDPSVWARAYRNIKGCEPGESIESITARRAAEKRVESALTGTPVNALGKTRSSQVDQQMPHRSGRGHAGGPTVRATRRKGDTAPYVSAARKQASITAKNAAKKDPS